MTITSAVPRTLRTKLQLVMPWGMIPRRGDPAGLDGQTSVSAFVLISALAQRCGFRFAGQVAASTVVPRYGSVVAAPSAMSGARIRWKAQKRVDKAALKSRAASEDRASE